MANPVQGFIVETTDAPLLPHDAVRQLEAIADEFAGLDPDDFPGNDAEIDYLRYTLDRLLVIGAILAGLPSGHPIYTRSTAVEG